MIIMNYVAVCGLISEIVSEKPGIPFDKQYVILLNEVTKSSKHLADSLRHIEQKLDAIIIGDISTGHIALGNAMSDEFSTDERLAQVNRARDFFEQGYARLKNLSGSELSLNKPEVAAYVALCHFLLGKKDKSGEWFRIAHKDYDLAESKSIDVILFEREFEETQTVAGIPVYSGIVMACLCFPGPIQLFGGAVAAFRWYKHDIGLKSKKQWEELVSEIEPKKEEISKIILLLNNVC
jgi:hypothetical protein